MTCARHGWQRCDQCAPVALRCQSPIQNRNHTFVGAAADQPPGGLGKSRRCDWKINLTEGLVAPHCLAPRLEQRVVGAGKRKFVENHQRQRATGEIDTLEKTL